MTRTRKKLKVLLIEPNYSNKYPPIGLMKIATYHKMLGHEVVFYKGDLKQFIIDRIADRCIRDCSELCNTVSWVLYKDIIVDFIRTKRKEFLAQLPIEGTGMEILLTAKFVEYKDFY